MPRLRTADLSGFVADVNAHGGNLGAAAVRERFHPIELVYDTRVDMDLDPFSDEYYGQQIDLYREIAGRDLDQLSGELHDEDLGRLLLAPNPTGSDDPDFVAETVRALTTMLAVAGPGRAARVLDLGAGHGLSSEVYAFAGCVVDAIDIDARLGTLARSRASRLGAAITRFDANFDDLGVLAGRSYDAAFFFQSLHHCLKPWELIRQLKPKLNASGVIAFTGEPIQQHWWRHWGIRLDEESLYVARQRGWFESGWSHAFLRECFARNGMALTFLTGGLLGGEIGIATAADARRQEVLTKARAMGLIETNRAGDIGIDDRLFHTATGRACEVAGRPAFAHDAAAAGTLVYGPYVDLEPGCYEITLLARRHSRLRARQGPALLIDVTADAGARELARWRTAGVFMAHPRLITRHIVIPARAVSAEVRVHVVRGRWTVSIPTVRRCEGDPGDMAVMGNGVIS